MGYDGSVPRPYVHFVGKWSRSGICCHRSCSFGHIRLRIVTDTPSSLIKMISNRTLRWLWVSSGLMVTGAFFLVVILVTYKANPSLFIETSVNPLSWKPPSVDKDLPAGDKGNQIRFGYLLISETSHWIGPGSKNPMNQYAGNNLSCKNCHLQAGTQAGSASWVGVTNRFPQFRGRENKIGTIEERINGCMERSMNGSPLPEDSNEMEAIVAYMEWLSEGVPQIREAEFKGFPSMTIPRMKADPTIGKKVYSMECEFCHGTSGEGIKHPQSDKGYLYPPLWGVDSYNHGAGMHRVITAAQFIKANMPFGVATAENPKLTDEEAYHVAAYINSFSRPIKWNTEDDFPDKKLKPVSTPYGPWDDNFSPEQHKYGPFQPIMAYYEKEHQMRKTK